MLLTITFGPPQKELFLSGGLCNRSMKGLSTLHAQAHMYGNTALIWHEQRRQQQIIKKINAAFFSLSTAHH